MTSSPSPSPTSSPQAPSFDWTAHYDEDGKLYYYNEKTGESSWEEPEEGFHPPVAEAADGEDDAADAVEEKHAKTHTKHNPWTKHTNDDGQEYYYNEATDTTQWEKPDDYCQSDAENNSDDEENHQNDDIMEEDDNHSDDHEDDANNSKSRNEEGAQPLAQTQQSQKDKDKNVQMETTDELTGDSTAPTSKWTKHTDDDGQVYYYNQGMDQTQWDKPDDYNSGDDNDDNDAVDDNRAVDETKTTEENMADPSPTWTEHVDDEGRTYYYNEQSGDTQWDPPDNFIEKDEPTTEQPKTKANSSWTKHTDDDGQEYYYNETSGETQWDKPSDFQDSDNEDDNDDGASPIRPSSPILLNNDGDSDESDGGHSPNHNKVTPTARDEKVSTVTNTIAGSSTWTKVTDDQGRDYYYNQISGETQWEVPSDYHDAATATDAGKGKWTKHTDEEGREYYFNETTNQTQWEPPAEYQETTDEETKGEEKKDDSIQSSSSSHQQKGKSSTVDASLLTEEEAEPQPDPIDPAALKLENAQNALNQPDAIMEPNCLDNVGELIESLGGKEGGAKAMQSLVTSFQGETAICGILAQWLADFDTTTTTSTANNNSAKSGTTSANVHSTAATGTATDEKTSATTNVREAVEEVVNKIAKERFTKAGGDNIFQLKKSEAVFLEKMMDSSIWRKLLIDLSATHRDSTLLSYCLSSISKRGHHREIAKRINQSDHFPVYTAMLSSELTVVGNGGEAMGMNELLDDLRRTCTSTSYTYLYVVELLRHLVHTATEKNDRSLIQPIRKWTRLREELEAAMVDPAVSSKTAGSSSLYRKRRRDVALTVSELHQRQRRRLSPGMEEPMNSHTDARRDALEQALSNLLLRHAESKQFDDQLLDQVLLDGEGNDDDYSKEIGRLLNAHPLAVEALIGHLFLPGSRRASSPTTLGKCAQLIAFAVLAAESATMTERGGSVSDPAARQARIEDIKRMLLTGNQACVIVENMVSFTVTSQTEVKDQSSSSAGIKLSVLANKCAPVAQGVVLWVKEMVAGSDFLTSASYPTISPSVLSLLRIISTRHPFTRPSILEVALRFLGHSNAELTYEKMNEIKEQALRLLLFLLVQGEVCAVLGSLASRLKRGDFLDASLVRYFVGGLLEIVAPPCSPLLVKALGSLLLTPKCVEALKSSYFAEKTTKLTTLLDRFRHDMAKREKEFVAMTESMVNIYSM